MKSINAIVFLVLMLLLTGCKTELYSNLPERDANEMLAILLQHSIPVDKQYVKGGLVTLFVNEAELARAITVLQSAGYPKPEFKDFCEVFKKEGLISSPVEERARVVCATTEDLSATLSQLDGVINAKVHVVMPETERGVVTQSSASVMIKHSAEVSLEGQISQIKMLVANSIPDLEDDNITVALFPSHKKASPGTATSGSSYQSSKRIGSEQKIAIGVVLLLMVGGAWFFVFGKKSRRPPKQAR